MTHIDSSGLALPEQPHSPEMAQRLRRALEVEQAIDPTGSLPVVGISEPTHANYYDENSDWTHSVITHDDHAVGICHITTNHRTRERWFGDKVHTGDRAGIRIFQPNQSRGFGIATHKQVISRSLREGYSFRTDPETNTERIKELWEFFVKVGVATVVEDFSLLSTGPNYTKYRGHYVIKHASDS